jgi:hypothetical protein
MYPKELFIVIEQDTMSNWKIYLNGICCAVYHDKNNAEQYIKDIERLNQGMKITVLTMEEINLKSENWLPTD